MKANERRFCWHCGRDLASKTVMDGRRVYFFERWKDEIGNEHVVHKQCGKTLAARRVVTAQPVGQVIQSPPDRYPGSVEFIVAGGGFRRLPSQSDER